MEKKIICTISIDCFCLVIFFEAGIDNLLQTVLHDFTTLSVFAVNCLATLAGLSILYITSNLKISSIGREEKLFNFLCKYIFTENLTKSFNHIYQLCPTSRI